jgi:histidine triad (HIT) family protein
MAKMEQASKFAEVNKAAEATEAAEAADDCLFCAFAHGKIDVTKVAENGGAFAINDINPVAPTHILIIPKKHFIGPAQAAVEDPAVIAAIFQLLAQISQQLHIDSYRTVFNTGAAAGQSVFHAHLHMIAGRSLNWPPG